MNPSQKVCHNYIAGNFQGRKLSRIGRKGAFCGENFGCKIAKFVKVFSLEGFLLYGNYYKIESILNLLHYHIQRISLPNL